MWSSQARCNVLTDNACQSCRYGKAGSKGNAHLDRWRVPTIEATPNQLVRQILVSVSIENARNDWSLSVGFPKFVFVGGLLLCYNATTKVTNKSRFWMTWFTQVKLYRLPLKTFNEMKSCYIFENVWAIGLRVVCLCVWQWWTISALAEGSKYNSLSRRPREGKSKHVPYEHLPLSFWGVPYLYFPVKLFAKKINS